MGAIAACTFAMGAAIVGLIYSLFKTEKKPKELEKLKKLKSKINTLYI